MEKLIDDLHNIIKDHREEEGFMTKDRITNWINQFDADDREFMLSETIHVFKKRYISKADGIIHIRKMIKYLAKTYENTDVKQFIAKTYFIDNQSAGKSQGLLLRFLDNILKEEFETSIDECNENNPAYIIYLDDILCTGETIIKGLADANDGWLHQENINGGTNYDYINKTEAKLILAYLAVHRRCLKTLGKRLYYGMGGKNVDFTYIWDTSFEIQNNYDDVGSELNFLFPSPSSLSESVEQCKDQIEAKLDKRGYLKSKSIQFRDLKVPEKENLFSSVAARERYEKLILLKSIEYYNSSHNFQQNIRPRPLGFGLSTDINFGFGTLIFSWRNVPFNTPLIFWYPHNGCIPLFERIHT